jgi:hypothetical protein
MNAGSGSFCAGDHADRSRSLQDRIDVSIAAPMITSQSLSLLLNCWRDYALSYDAANTCAQ